MSPAPKPAAGRRGWRPATTASTPPATRPIAESLSRDGGLASLLARVRESEDRLRDVRAIVPADLGARLRAGPLDDEGWTLLAASSAIAAKLRHLLPMIVDGLQSRGWPPVVVRVKVHVPD